MKQSPTITDDIRRAIEEWRSDFDIVAAVTGAGFSKRLEANPAGRYRVKVNGGVAYVGDDEALAIAHYVRLDPQ